MLTNFFESAALTLVILMIWLACSAFASHDVGKRGTLIAGIIIVILGGVAGSMFMGMAL